MSRSERFPFSVRVDAPPGGRSVDSHITVLDSRDEPRAEGHGQLDSALPAGLYTVRVERAGARVERVERHAGPTSIELPEPLRYSAVPTVDTASTHEYYVEPAEQWSLEETAPSPAAAQRDDGSLFVFLRAPSNEVAREPPVDGRFRLLDYDGTELYRLDTQCVRYDSVGWVAFHASIAPGEYVLAFAGDGSSRARELAVAVFGRWQTQVFITYVSTPLFASASILISQNGFTPDDRIARIVDAALARLQSGRGTLPLDEADVLLYGKFDNPMLGLVGLHALLQTPDPDKQRVEMILGNLHALLGYAPDVRALELLAADRLGLGFDDMPFDRPPLLRRGLDAVLRAAAGPRAQLVLPGSLLAAIAPRVFADCPWSSWEPIVGRREAATPEWVTGYVHDAIITASRRDVDFDPERAAAKVALPVASIASAYEQLRATMPASDERTIALERLVARARAQAPTSSLTPEQVREHFTTGAGGARVEALALMQGSARLRDFGVALEAINASRSAFEQYHALRLANAMIASLDASQRHELMAAIDTLVGADGPLRPGQDRWHLAQRIRSQLAALG